MRREPDDVQVSAALDSGHASIVAGRDGICVAVELEPRPGWKRVGRLERD